MSSSSVSMDTLQGEAEAQVDIMMNTSSFREFIEKETKRSDAQDDARKLDELADVAPDALTVPTQAVGAVPADKEAGNGVANALGACASTKDAFEKTPEKAVQSRDASELAGAGLENTSASDERLDTNQEEPPVKKHKQDDPIVPGADEEAEWDEPYVPAPEAVAQVYDMWEALFEVYQLFDAHGIPIPEGTSLDTIQYHQLPIHLKLPHEVRLDANGHLIKRKPAKPKEVPQEVTNKGADNTQEAFPSSSQEKADVQVSETGNETTSTSDKPGAKSGDAQLQEKDAETNKEAEGSNEKPDAKTCNGPLQEKDAETNKEAEGSNEKSDAKTCNCPVQEKDADRQDAEKDFNGEAKNIETKVEVKEEEIDAEEACRQFMALKDSILRYYGALIIQDRMKKIREQQANGNKEVKDEVKEEETLDPAADDSNEFGVADVKVEVKDEELEADHFNNHGVANVEVKEEQTVDTAIVKTEVKEEVKQEVKEECESGDGLGVAAVKVEVKTEVKEERPPKGPKVVIKQEFGHTLKVEMKEEDDRSRILVGGVKKEESASSSVVVKRSLLDSTSSFAARLPLWIKMCTDFKKTDLTWALTRPCCLPCMFMLPYQSPEPDEKRACYYRMNKKEKRVFRRWVENLTEEEEKAFLTPNRREFYLHPEKVPIKKEKIKKFGPRNQRTEKVVMREYEHQRAMPHRAWGAGWMFTKDGIVKMSMDSCGSEIFEGVGTVKEQAGQVKRASKKSTDSVAAPSAKWAKLHGITWDDRSGQWDVVWYMGTWRQVKHFNILHYWPRGTYGGLDEVDRPLALEAALQAASAFYSEKKAAGHLRKPSSFGENSLLPSEVSQALGQGVGSSSLASEGGAINPSSGSPSECRQSGVSGISWHLGKSAWQLQYHDPLQDGRRVKPCFNTKTKMANGMTFEEACDAALEEAKAHRAKLVAQGTIKAHDEDEYQERLRQSAVKKTCKGRKSLFQNTKPPTCSVSGVYWSKRDKAWLVTGGYSKRNGVPVRHSTPANPSRAAVSASFQELLERIRKYQREHGLPEIGDGHVIF